MVPLFYVVRPAGRTYLEVQVLYTPDRESISRTAGKRRLRGYHREVLAEGSRRQVSERRETPKRWSDEQESHMWRA